MDVKKLNAAAYPVTATAQVGFSFEKQEQETEQEYALFNKFLNDPLAASPAKWIQDNNLDPEFRYIANHNGWIQRRLDLWSHNAAAQRNKWVMLLDLQREVMLERVEIHRQRAHEAREIELADKALGEDFDRVVRTMSLDIKVALGIVEALRDNDDTRVTIFNQAIGSVLRTKDDVSGMQQSWDAVSRNVIEGTAKVKDAES